MLGIDPGFHRMGYGVIESIGSKIKMIDYGSTETSKTKSIGERILEISCVLREIIKKHQPDSLILEELFFFKNLKTAINVAQARGAIILVAEECCLPVVELTPLQVKQSVTGFGRAEKGQIQKMVKTLLNLKEIPKPDDAADALAIAIAGSSWVKYE
ncbi:MAG: crossover junction endodeoxyribonuclease RuvC [Candidatus Magasanikbacteria bacterium RIFOXYB2_FULL_38_10]|nr:MAG: crossover junction endodeoxyribonuclease RuvC [Candidatus Magasanikbacteria bacterium RIFOXYB2_FULL_38_10]